MAFDRNIGIALSFRPNEKEKKRKKTNLFEMETKNSQEMEKSTISFRNIRNTEASYFENKCESFREKRATNIKMRNLNFYTNKKKIEQIAFRCLRHPRNIWLACVWAKQIGFYIILVFLFFVPSPLSPSIFAFSACVSVCEPFGEACMPTEAIIKGRKYKNPFHSGAHAEHQINSHPK